jgi:imidazolonepropionase-like amidohydrolase
LKTEADVKAYIKQNIADGADYIKLMHESGFALGANFNKPTVELQEIIIKEAHAAGKVAIAHALCMADHSEILNAGIDGLAHTFFDQPPTQELIDAYKRKNAWLNPTLAAIGSLTTEGKDIAEKFAHDERVQHLIGEKEREHLCMCMAFGKDTAKLEYAYESVRQLKANGIDIIWSVSLPIFSSPS